MNRTCPARSMAHSDSLRLLDLDDHVGGGEHGSGIFGNVRSGCDIIVVGEIDAAAGLCLDRDPVPARGQFRDGWRREADAIFVDLDFLGYADVHRLVLAGGGGAIARDRAGRHVAAHNRA